MDAPRAHLLSLKVMRVSRPELADAWHPFYSSSPLFSAHSTASVLSLQGTIPLPGHPKTLRDLSHTTQFLTLPSSFGSIQLGETFSSCLCINNEAHVDIDGVSVKVEMQTASSKIVLADLGGSAYQIASGDTFESIVTHEIKELGQHVLACTVTYRLPLNHPPLVPAENSDDLDLQTFRKFYKFAVTNPLSVKTKVHMPRSPTALMSPPERDKVFLEVHIQNLTSNPLHFERMQFECTDDWNAVDTNVLASDDHVGLFSGSQALMHPQDIRQYTYILTPKSVSLAPLSHPPGSTIHLGQLDIFWRSSFGEPGRLLTSMLSRRIPLLAPVPQSIPTLPSYIKRAITASLPSRPQSPQPSQSRPGTPSNRPASPSQSRSSPMGAVGTTPRPSTSPHASDIEVSLIQREPTPRSVQLEKPFSIPFSLILSAPIRQGISPRRTIKLVVQHLQPQRTSQALHPLVHVPSATLSSRLSSGFSTPSSPQPTFSYAIADQKLLTSSPQQKRLDEIEGEHQPDGCVTLPPPFFSNADESNSRPSTGVVFAGSSALFLPSVELSVSVTEPHGDAIENVTRLRALQDFELSYFPRQRGYTTIGGLRVLLVGDNLTDAEKEPIYTGDVGRMSPAVTLKEWDVVAEVWVSL